MLHAIFISILFFLALFSSCVAIGYLLKALESVKEGFMNGVGFCFNAFMSLFDK